MILFVFNHPFPNNTGFSNRVAMELRALSRENEVFVLCRKSGNEPKREVFSVDEREIPIYRFSARLKHMERVDTGYTAGIYEILRSVDLCIDFCIQLLKLIFSVKGVKQLYVTATPLTIPFYAYLISLFTRVPLSVLEFHDLEPEVAKDIKGISDDHPVMKIEYFLEKFLSQRFRKVVVTSPSQKKRIVERTHVRAEQVFVLPNLVSVPDMKKYPVRELRKKYSIPQKAFVLSYSGNLSYDYTISGVIDFVRSFHKLLSQIPTTVFLIAGDGDGKKHIEKEIHKQKLDGVVCCLGRVGDVREVLAVTDVALIPWTQDEMTETILPTKLFEYMASGRAILAPDFGEFSRVIEDGTNGHLYKTLSQSHDILKALAEDSSKREKLGANALKHYREEYAPEKMFAGYRTFITRQV